jgi:hypothetical protein
MDFLNEQETETAIRMTDDRNLTNHTYDEDLADEIFNKLPEYYALLKIWYDKLSR